MKAFLDAIPIPEENLTKSLKHPTFNIRNKDENGDNVVSFSEGLEFIEDQYDYIYAQLKTDVNALTNVVVLRLENECCSNQAYEFDIKHDSLDWCEGSCRLRAAAIEKSITNEQLICLKNTLIWDNWNGFQAIQHPRMVYCNEIRPNFIQHFMIQCVIAFATILLILSPVIIIIQVMVGIMNAIINALNAIIPGTDNDLSLIDWDDNPETSVFQEYKSWATSLLDRAIGCGRKHPSPLVRNYADNVCGKCGISFVSSIFKNPASAYNNTVYVNAPVDKGVLPNNNTTFWLDRNKPLLNGTMFFDQLKNFMNLDWRVKNSTLTLERRDFFDTNGTPFIDLSFNNVTKTYNDPRVIKVCWNWEKKDKPSYANFEYQKDAFNWVGAEARQRWGDIVEWNSPYTPNQKGEFKPLIEFGSCRFRNDGIDDDILTFYENNGYIGPRIKEYQNAIMSGSHTFFTPMLLIWDESSGVIKSTVSGSNFFIANYPGVQLNQFFNYPFWFDANNAGNLYTNFWYINDPRDSNYIGLGFDAEIEADCELLAILDIDGIVNTSEGNSKKLNDININFEQNKITITGVV